MSGVALPVQPVILCGGAGTRLWPASTPARPKPFIDLLGHETLFQRALARVADPEIFAPPLVVGGTGHVGLIEAQAGAHSLIVEPEARNTAPAIALAAARLDPRTVMLVCPSDHHVADTDAFVSGVRSAAALAADGWLVSLGIKPERAETGYGYIERGDPLGSGFRTARFVEKPDRETAASYVAGGRHLWNGGIFAFAAGRYLEELARYRPGMVRLVTEAVDGGREQDGRFYPASAPFSQIEADSVDYAVMEQTDRAAVVEVDMGWSDVGSWPALQALLAEGAGNNAAKAPARLSSCSRVMVRSDGPRVSVLGLSDVIVVVENGEVLVMASDAAQDVASLAKKDAQ